MFARDVGCAQRTDDMKIMFDGARGAPYKLRPNGRVVKKKKDALTRSFSPDYSGILPTTMAMQAVAERIIEITGM